MKTTIRTAAVALALVLAAPASAGIPTASPHHTAAQVHIDRTAAPSGVIVETTRPRETESEMTAAQAGGALHWWNILLGWARTMVPALPTL